MKGLLISNKTEDGLIMQGFYCPTVQKKSIVIHIHGSFGNFYENFFLKEMSEQYNANGFSFLSIRTRGSDYYSDFKMFDGEGYQSRRIGGIREVFQECILDIEPWIIYSKERGYSEIYLQGHSLGAMKSVFFNRKSPLKIDGLILISPPDSIGLQKNDNGDDYEKYKSQALKMMQEDKLLLMPNEAYFEAITCEAFYNMMKEEETGMFTYRDVDLMKKAGMDSINIPTFISFATKNEAVIDSIDFCINALKKSCYDESLLHFEVVENANHNYHLRENTLVNSIVTWLRGLN